VLGCGADFFGTLGARAGGLAATGFSSLAGSPAGTSAPNDDASEFQWSD
jgi:hypothetical protein